MIEALLRRIASSLPRNWQGELKRLHYRRRIRRGTFISDEPEFGILSDFITVGDCVVDIGANVGFYTKRFAELVGPHGRVIAFEPVPETFVLLANNAALCGFENVTLVNAAISETASVVGMTVPRYPDTEKPNFYQAHIASDGELRVVGFNLDAFRIPMPVRLIKIDVEGNELAALKGMQLLLARDHPVLIIETNRQDVWDFLGALGYVGSSLPSSPNVIFDHTDRRLVGLKALP